MTAKINNIDKIIIQYQKKLLSVKKEIKTNIDLYGSPSVYWDHHGLNIKHNLYSTFIYQLEKLKEKME